MSEMIKRVAAALREVLADSMVRADMNDVARAVLQELRDPDMWMVTKGAIHRLDYVVKQSAGDQIMLGAENAISVWHAMIDKALEE